MNGDEVVHVGSASTQALQKSLVHQFDHHPYVSLHFLHLQASQTQHTHTHDLDGNLFEYHIREPLHFLQDHILKISLVYVLV